MAAKRQLARSISQKNSAKGRVGSGRVDLKVPYVIRQVHGNGTLEAVDLHHTGEEGLVERVDCDAVLLQLGFSTKLGPLKEWGFEL